MINDALFSSENNTWETPQYLFDQLNAEYKFQVDVCANNINAKCNYYFSPELDGLKQDWSKFKSCWMNPPYGREISKWIEKAYNESKKGTIVVALLPARTDTKWFHDYIYNKDGVDIKFIKGRIKFVNAINSAPFPSMIVVFTDKNF